MNAKAAILPRAWGANAQGHAGSRMCHASPLGQQNRKL
ncbi:hypothetical protein BURCENBC7_AP7409 [Burkholderia cenocepacia BC7]|nr:hypothetical protein BURCENK562V_C0947 [Burkholderia cenocepacia K56-2Valvano]ERI24926.1 hypothetical protein BURCENBC7_AP7409 [Burkholderia cenocepacia BC7]